MFMNSHPRVSLSGISRLFTPYIKQTEEEDSRQHPSGMTPYLSLHKTILTTCSSLKRY